MTILVTGAASGIGAALMPMLKTNTIALDRTMMNDGVACDLSDPAAIAAFALSVTVPLDGIAHVAGLPGTHDAAAVVAVNTLAPIALTTALLPRLRDGASIVTVSSITALRCDWSTGDLDALIDMSWSEACANVAALPGARAYEVSKAAVNRWTQRMAAMLQPHRIRMTTVSPGPVETPIFKDFETSIGADRLAVARELTGRHAQPSDVAGVIAFLLSDAARWVNGSDIRADGGYHAMRSFAAG